MIDKPRHSNHTELLVSLAPSNKPATSTPPFVANNRKSDRHATPTLDPPSSSSPSLPHWVSFPRRRFVPGFTSPRLAATHPHTRPHRRAARLLLTSLSLLSDSCTIPAHQEPENAPACPQAAHWFPARGCKCIITSLKASAHEANRTDTLTRLPPSLLHSRTHALTD